MGRRAKNKQGMPPTLDEFNELKQKGSGKVNKNDKRKRSEEAPAKSKRAKNIKKQKDDIEEHPEGLPQVDLEELASAKKSLFDEDDEEDVGNEEFENLDDLEDDELVDSDEEARVQPMFSDDDDDEDLEGLNAANMEAYSKQLDDDEELEAEEAELELTQGAPQPRAKVLPTEEEEAMMAEHPTDVTSVRTRMIEIVKVLENFKELAEEGKSRADYTSRLLKDICEYFG